MHRKRYGKAHGPICHVTAGYCAGWYSARSASSCWSARSTAQAWPASAGRLHRCAPRRSGSAGDAWAQGLLKYLDYEAMRESALKRLAQAGDEVEGDRWAPSTLSPAVHVWGPVMVLPYSGAGDSVAALETISPTSALAPSAWWCST